jgi:ferrochelatase
MKRTGILVVNLGTPNSYSKKDVAIYLREFLMDGRVIDIPFWKRWLLVNLIIVPFRAPKVAHEYKKLWLENGSPLMVYGKELVAGLKQYFKDDVTVELAMRYQNPSIGQGLKNLRQAKVDQIIIFPLFPQYASATTGSVVEKVMAVVSKWNVIPSLKFINSYHTDEQYISNFAAKVKNDLETFKPDHILFSYHGVPERHLDNLNEEGVAWCSHTQDKSVTCYAKNRWCYRSACFETSHLIAAKLGLADDKFTVAFQSRLGKDPWIKPYTDATLKELTGQGVKKLLVVSPSFVADCLETTLEIGEQYRDLFLSSGGEEFHFTKSLNADSDWIKTVYSLINNEIKKNLAANEMKAFNSLKEFQN